MAAQSLIKSGINNFSKHRNLLVGNPFFSPSFALEYLVIAGGGGQFGGSSGGCGAGGYRSNVSGQVSGGGASAEASFTGNSDNLSVNYTITIGAGGSDANGFDSVFSVITSIGGGRGGGGNGAAGLSGGSGGGSAGNAGGVPTPGAEGTTDQGFRGGQNDPYGSNGYCGGGGGGAGGVGANASPTRGPGASSNITGIAITRALGGGGYGGSNPSPPPHTGAGAINTGGGGSNAAGGSGVVILRYPDTKTITVGAGLTGSTATDGSFRVTTITEGTGNVSFA
jgi:hypothetical protein